MEKFTETSVHESADASGLTNQRSRSHMSDDVFMRCFPDYYNIYVMSRAAYLTKYFSIIMGGGGVTAVLVVGGGGQPLH